MGNVSKCIYEHEQHKQKMSIVFSQSTETS